MNSRYLDLILPRKNALQYLSGSTLGGLPLVYWITGGALILIALAVLFILIRRRRRNGRPR